MTSACTSRSASHLPSELAHYRSFINELSVTKEGDVLKGHSHRDPDQYETTSCRACPCWTSGHRKNEASHPLTCVVPWDRQHMVERRVRLCNECQANSDRQSFEPMKPTKMPGQYHGRSSRRTYLTPQMEENGTGSSISTITRTGPGCTRFEQPTKTTWKRYNDTPHSTTGVAPNQLLFGFSRSSVTQVWSLRHLSNGRSSGRRR